MGFPGTGAKPRRDFFPMSDSDHSRRGGIALEKTYQLPKVRQRLGSWIAHASKADTRRLRHTLFAGGWFDPFLPATPEPDGPPVGRVLRGGSFNNKPQNARAAKRNRNTPTNRNNHNGFRLASTTPPAGTAVFTETAGVRGRVHGPS